MVSFDEALSAVVCDARFGLDPCASLIWLLCFISFCGLFVNFLPRCYVFSRVTKFMWCSDLLFHVRRPWQDIFSVRQVVPSCSLTEFDVARF